MFLGLFRTNIQEFKSDGNLPFFLGRQRCLVHHPKGGLETSSNEFFKTWMPGTACLLLDVIDSYKRDFRLPPSLSRLLPRFTDAWKEILQVLMNDQMKLVRQLCGHPVPSVPVKQGEHCTGVEYVLAWVLPV